MDNLNNINNTVVVLITDNKYFSKAKRTIIDIRSVGRWNGDIVLITIDFDCNQNFKDFYKITEAKFPQIDKSELLQKLGPGFPNWDGRELNKLNQWEKLHVFDTYFLKWKRVIFVDAGLRVLNSLDCLLDIDYENKFLAPNDAGDGPIKMKGKLFHTQISNHNKPLLHNLGDEFGVNIFNSEYFLNCIWIYDTNILNIIKKSEMIELMNKYPLCKTNEMAVMNLLIHFKHKLWIPFPYKNKDNKYLFEWCETNKPGTTWRDYCLIKYPVTISFEDT